MSRMCQHHFEDIADPLVRQCIKSFSSPRSIWLTWKGSAACHLSNPCLRRHPKKPFGGIRPIALMEDYDFIKRLEEAGETVCIEDWPTTLVLVFRGSSFGCLGRDWKRRTVGDLFERE